MEYIKRESFIEQLKNWRDKNVIKVVTGVRRSGKSTLFDLFVEELKSSGVTDEQIVRLNLEDAENDHLTTYKELYEVVKSQLVPDKMNYIFIDEVQMIDKFQKAVNSIYIKKNCDVYITGSNSDMLSSELATLLSGRYIEIKMMPLSFGEYSEFVKATDRRQQFAEYLKFGSFPYVSKLEKNDEIVKMYLDGIYNSILIKDIAKRMGITDISILDAIAKFLCDNIGNSVSSKKIADNINASGRKVSVNTVDSYLRALTESFIFYKCDRFDLKGKMHLKTLGKYYIVDTGFRNMLLGNKGADMGRQIENVAYLELLRRGNKVSVGKRYEKEVDFVVENFKGREYYQVCLNALDEETLKRELAPLQAISDNYPKFLLALDDFSKGDYEGIEVVNLIDWLLNS